MNKLFLIIIVILIGCRGDNGTPGQSIKGAPGTPGLPGNVGPAGPSGSNGLNIVSATVPATLAQCTNGGTVLLLAQDSLGTNVYDISDSGQVSAVICNGASGVTPFSAMAPILACGSASSPWKEVMLCLNNGSVIASFSGSGSALDTRLSFIPAGSYVNTDSSNCHFNVTIAGDGSTTVSWSAGSNSYSSWSAGSSLCQAN